MRSNISYVGAGGNEDNGANESFLPPDVDERSSTIYNSNGMATQGSGESLRMYNFFGRLSASTTTTGVGSSASIEAKAQTTISRTNSRSQFLLNSETDIFMVSISM